jgi:glycosyltransferase involved in cell wall biosynthesis
MSFTILEASDGLFFGGGQQHILLLARYINRDRFRLIILSHQDGEFRHELEKEGVPIFIIGLTSFIKVFNFIRRENIRLIHCHSTRWAFFFRFTKFIHKRPVVITIHGYHGRKYEFDDAGKIGGGIIGRIRIIVERLLNIFADRLVCVSEEDRRYLVKNRLSPKAKTIVIPNGIELSRFRLPVKVPSQKELIVLDVARFHFQKGHKYLVSAIPGILKKNPGTKFVFIGDGEIFDKIKKQVYEYLLLPSEKVIFLGRKSDVRPFLEQSDIFVSPSLWEGLPIALIEASAAGLAIVATDAPGNREVIVDGETGLLVESQSVSALEEGIERLIANQELRNLLGRNARMRAIELFDIKNTVAEVENLYREMIS